MYLWRLMRIRNFNVFTGINYIISSFTIKLLRQKLILTSF